MFALLSVFPICELKFDVLPLSKLFYHSAEISCQIKVCLLSISAGLHTTLLMTIGRDLSLDNL